LSVNGFQEEAKGMNRRRFIALIGAAVPGLWFDGTGLIQLPKRMVILISGRCSFCGKAAGQVFGLAGVTRRSTRVCNECIDLCLEILSDDLHFAPPPTPRHAPSMFGYPEDAPHPPPPLPPAVEHYATTEGLEAFDFELIGVTRDARAPQSRAELEAFIEEWRMFLDQPETSRPRRDKELLCSFCDQKQHEVKKLIAGPRVFICDVCIGDAAALISIHS
jgi:hypothetical protein